MLEATIRFGLLALSSTIALGGCGPGSLGSERDASSDGGREGDGGAAVEDAGSGSDGGATADAAGSVDCRLGPDCGGDCSRCGLSVYAPNPRYFTYRGRVRPLISSGGARLTDARLVEWGSVGIDQVRSGIQLTVRDSPYRYAAGRGVDDNWGGFDDAYWDARRAKAAVARDQGVPLFFFVWSSPMLICSRDGDCPDRFGAHLWNADNGGPLRVTDPGIPAAKQLLYQLATPGEPLFGRVEYDPAWGWRRKSQYRTEQLFAEVARRFPREEFPNVAIVQMWEQRVGWRNIDGAGAWAHHMTDFLRSVAPEVPIGVGAHEPWMLEESGADFGLANGFTTLDVVPDRWPVVFEGYHPREAECWAPGRPEPQCTCFDGAVESGSCGTRSDEECNGDFARAAIRAAILGGYNASMPFPQYWSEQSGRVALCEPIGEFDYDRAVVKADLYAYLAELRPVLDGVETWDDEPGDELTAATVP